jgi:Tfp pilus assembly protein PilF
MTTSRTLALLSCLWILACGSGAKASKDAEYYYSLAVNSFYSQNSQAALKELTQCFAADPKHTRAHVLAGLIYLGRMQYSDARTHLETALRLAPQFLEARANLGVVLLATGDWQGAIDVLQPLLQEPSYPTPYLVENNLGWAYYNLGKHTQAELHFRRALFLNGEMCLAYNNIAIVHEEMGRMEDAIEEYLAAIKRCPEYVEPYFRVGVLLERRGRGEEAARHWRKCAKIGGEGMYARRCARRLEVLR